MQLMYYWRIRALTQAVYVFGVRANDQTRLSVRNTCSACDTYPPLDANGFYIYIYILKLAKHSVAPSATIIPIT